MRLELSLYAHRLQNVAGIFQGTSDPYAVVTQLPSNPNDKPAVLGETEVIRNTLSPEWTTTIRLPEYEMGSPTCVAVSIYDHSNNTSTNKKSMGCVLFDVSDILAAKGQVMGKRLTEGRGTVYASVRALPGDAAGVIRLTLQCRNLPNVETGGTWRRDKSDPFLVLSRPMISDGGVADDAGHAWDNVFRSAPAMNNLDPTFDVSMELSTLCSGNMDASVLVSVYDFEQNGHHVEMGSVRTTVNELLAMASADATSELTLVSPGDALDSGSVAGTISVLKAQVTGTEEPSSTVVSGNEVDALSDQIDALSVAESPAAVNAVATSPAPPTPTFVDYLRVGCTLNCCVAIDFTSSNGDPSHPTSLHYSGTTTSASNDEGSTEPKRNAYEQALRAVLTPLRPFDDDGFWPVLGFGKHTEKGTVSHCFQVGKTEWSKGVDGVIASYLGTVASPNLILSGPMIITKVLENGANRARKSLEKERKSGRLSYVCFLLVANADGHVAEFEATVACLRQLRDDAPMSVIMVGIRSAGDAASSADSAHPRPNSLEELAAQSPDNCIYVPFQDGESSIDVSKLALHDLPNQIVNWFLRHDIRPPPSSSRVVAEEDIVVTDQED